MVAKYTAGLWNVGSYQSSGSPWVTGSTGLSSEDKIQFPAVTKSVTVIAPKLNDVIRVHFNSEADGLVIQGRHYIPLTGSTFGGAGSSSRITLDVKCKEIYISTPSGPSDYVVVAELTGISTEQMYALTGSGLTTVG